MKNIFFNQKENWLFWLIVGFCAAAIVYIIASNTQSSGFIYGVQIAIFALVTFYMSYLRRFSFQRALKISTVVFSLALMPVLLFNFEQLNLFGNADIVIRFFVLFIVALSSSVVCSLIVRKPQDYL